MKNSDDRVPSRREFLTASALSVFGLSSRPKNSVRIQSQRDDVNLYVGTFTEGGRTDRIHLVRFDAASGQLVAISSVNAGPNPSFLALHPNGGVLYAVNEVEQRDGTASGGVSSFAIDRDTGALRKLNEQTSEGGAPCYVSVDRDGQVVLVANYMGGNVALFPIARDGSLSPAASIARHRGTGPNKERQQAPHAHFIAPDPSNRFALVADLGIDRVLVYRLQLQRKALLHSAKGDATLRAGAGPRHLDFHPTLPLVFVANELDSTVTVARFDGASGVLTPQASYSTLPAGWKGTNYVADIHVAPSGRTLYVSNRGHNSIAAFSISESGALAFIQVVSTAGDWPRNFSLDPTGRWLLVANQRSGTIIVFQCDERTGRLTSTKQRLAIPSPVCVRFR